MKASQKAWLIYPSKTTEYRFQKEVAKTSLIAVNEGDGKIKKYDLGYSFYNPTVIYMQCHSTFLVEYHEDTQWRTFEDVAHPLLAYRASFVKYADLSLRNINSLYPFYIWSTIQRTSRRMHNSLESLRRCIDSLNSNIPSDVHINILTQRNIATIVKHLDIYQTSKVTLNKPAPANIPSPIVSDKNILITRIKSHLIFYTRTFHHYSRWVAGNRLNPEIFYIPYNQALGNWIKLGIVSPITNGKEYMLPSTSELSESVGIGVIMNYDCYRIKIGDMSYDVELVSRLNPMQSKLLYNRLEELKKLEMALPVEETTDGPRNKHLYVDNRHHSQLPIVF